MTPERGHGHVAERSALERELARARDDGRGTDADSIAKACESLDVPANVVPLARVRRR